VPLLNFSILALFRQMHLAGPVLPLIYLATLVAADTEIINFRSGQTVSRALAVLEFSLVLIQTIARNIISHVHAYTSRVLRPLESSFVISTTPSPAAGNTVPTGYQELDGLCEIKASDMQKARADADGVVFANDSLTPCPGDTWVILDTGAQGWGFDRLTMLITGRGNEAFTLRASWAASVRSLPFTLNRLIQRRSPWFSDYCFHFCRPQLKSPLSSSALSIVRTSCISPPPRLLARPDATLLV